MTEHPCTCGAYLTCQYWALGRCIYLGDEDTEPLEPWPSHSEDERLDDPRHDQASDLNRSLK